MGFLKVLFCCVETLIVLNFPVHGQFFPNSFNPPANPTRNFPGNSNNFNPFSQPGGLNNNGGNTPFHPNPFDSPTNPVNKGPGNFNNPLANNPYLNPATNPFLNPANNPFPNLANNPFTKPANNPFTNPSNNPFTNPFMNPANNPFTNPANNPFTNPANNPFTYPVNRGPGNFNNNPLANNPANQPSRFPSRLPKNDDGILQFLPNPYDNPTNPVNQSPGNLNNFNPPANSPLNKPFSFPDPSKLPNDDGIIQFVPNPYDDPHKPAGNFPPRNQPPLNNFNKPPATPLFQSPANRPGGFSPFNPNANNPPNRPFNPPQPANLNNFTPLPSLPPLPSSPPHKIFGQQPHLSGLPPSSPIYPAQYQAPMNHSSPPPAPPIHHVSPAPHPKPKPPPTPPPPPKPDKDPLEGHRLVCIFNNKHYFRNEFSPANIESSLCTHVNYEFAMLDPKSYEMIPSEPELDIQMEFFEEAIKLKKSNKRLKVLISLGGWADSTEKYSILAAKEDLRKNFVETTVHFIKKHEFDGMDFAWEYPNCWQGACGISKKDKKNFVLLLKELREAFDPEKLELSISVGAVKREVEEAYDIPEVSKYVDFINVMTYDMHGPWDSRTGHHTQFDRLPWDEDPYWNSKGALKVWVEGGAPKMKLNMGIALYGKTFTLADPDENGLNAPTIGVGNSNIDSVEGGFILYNTMCQWLNDGNWTEKEDRRAGFYAYAGDQWSCYDPPMMVVRKAKFIVEEGYGGLLFKDLGGDDYLGKCFSMPFPILKMARFEMLHKIHAKHRRHG